MSLGSNIKKHRFELNLSQQELTNLMGDKSRSTIAKIEGSINNAKIVCQKDVTIVTALLKQQR